MVVYLTGIDSADNSGHPCDLDQPLPGLSRLCFQQIAVTSEREGKRINLKQIQ